MMGSNSASGFSNRSRELSLLSIYLPYSGCSNVAVGPGFWRNVECQPT